MKFMTNKYVTTIITAAGESHANSPGNEIGLPHNLTQDGGGTILERAITSYATNPEMLKICIRDSEKFDRSSEVILRERFPKAEVFVLPSRGTKGALATAVIACGAIPAQTPLVIAAGDSEVLGGIQNEINSFVESDVDGGTICFQSDLEKYSYVDANLDSCEVIEVAEKRVISNLATTGVFYFKTSELFLNAAKWCLVNNTHTGGNFFTSTALNFLISLGKRVEMREIESARYTRQVGNNSRNLA